MIVSVGSINVDVQVRLDAEVFAGASMMAHAPIRASGGKAGNVALLARRLGAEALLLGSVGDDDLAEQALAGPRREGVDVSRVARVVGPTGLCLVVVPPNGAKTMFVALEANDRSSAIAGAVGADVAVAPAGSVLVVDVEVASEVALAAARAAAGRGLLVVLDPAPPDRVTPELLVRAEHLTPDHREATTLTGVDAGTREGAVEAARALRERAGGAAHVKLASGGCALADEAGVELIQPPDLPVVDTTGAGDAYAGTLAWALHEGHGTRAAARLAVAASAWTVGRYGSQAAYPGRDELAEVHRLVPPSEGTRPTALGRKRQADKPRPGGAPMASASRTTTDHDEIRRWAEDHDGKPVSVAGTAPGEEAGVLRIDFPGGAGSDRLKPISWDKWFAKFDEEGLALLYQERKANGDDSTFFKLVER